MVMVSNATYEKSLITDAQVQKNAAAIFDKYAPQEPSLKNIDAFILETAQAFDERKLRWKTAKDLLDRYCTYMHIDPKAIYPAGGSSPEQKLKVLMSPPVRGAYADRNNPERNVSFEQARKMAREYVLSSK